MKKSRLVFLLLSLALLLPAISGTLSRAAIGEGGSVDSLSKNLSVFSEVLSLIRRAYVDETSMTELLAGALDGTTDALDPLATFVPADDVEDYREVREIGRSRSGLTVAKDRGLAFVVAVDQGSPGEVAGLAQGDILAKVDEVSTRPMPLWRLQSLLAGDPGTDLALEVLRRGQTLDLDLTLAPYETLGPVRRQVRDEVVVRLARFEPEDLDTLRGIVAELTHEGIDRMVIDLRGAAGGQPEVAYRMAGLFVAGALGNLQVRGDTSLEFQSEERLPWRGETVLLIDNGTQGAAEVFATVMRQGTGSQLVGRRSFGLAGRQRLIALSDGSHVLLTDAFYSGPDGDPIDQSLIPDVVVADLVPRAAGANDDSADPTLDKGIDLLLEDQPEALRDVA